jgi:hypothetical protein
METYVFNIKITIEIFENYKDTTNKKYNLINIDHIHHYNNKNSSNNSENASIGGKSSFFKNTKFKSFINLYFHNMNSNSNWFENYTITWEEFTNFFR